MENQAPQVEGTGVTVVKTTSKTIVRCIILAALLFIGIAGFCLYKFHFLPAKIDREAPRYYPIVNVFLPSFLPGCTG